jgi:hypothetical protein
MRFCRSAGNGVAVARPTELVLRIRRHWHDNKGPTAALENALDIIGAYLGRGSDGRAA